MQLKFLGRVDCGAPAEYISESLSTLQPRDTLAFGAGETSQQEVSGFLAATHLYHSRKRPSSLTLHFF